MSDLVHVTPFCQRGKGFVLPDGYSWDAVLSDGKKEGKITVEDEFGCIACVLHFQNDKLNGVCDFYDKGMLVEKRTFVNDVEEGWGCEIELDEVVRRFFYVNGVRNAELKKCTNMKDYWQAVSIASNQVISICRYDDNHIPIGKGYLFDNGSISRIVLFENGKEKSVLKMFEGKDMTEYDNSGNIVYKGGFGDDVSKDYPREGKGIEFVGRVLVYAGEWKDNMRNGKGHTLKNRVAEYQGEWKEGLPHGLGLLKRDGKSYKGNWDMGKLELDNGETYDYVNGQIIRKNVKEFEPTSQSSQPRSIKTVKMIVNENQLSQLFNNEEMKRSVTELVIAEGCGNGWKGNMKLCGFENLESLFVKKNSLKNMESLSIFNNPELKSIETENGYGGDCETSRNTGPFYYVKSVTIKSTRVID